jgi:chromosome segregation ATPase
MSTPEQLEALNSVLLMVGNDYSDVLLPAATKIADLTAKLAEAERERDSANFDKSRMLDERQIFLKGLDELRTRLAEAERERDAEYEGGLEWMRTAVERQTEKLIVMAERDELRAEVARLTDERDKALSWVSTEQDEVDIEKQAREAGEARLRDLRLHYLEAIEDIEEWGGYASSYFQNKHDLAGTVAEHRAALAKSHDLTQSITCAWWQDDDGDMWESSCGVAYAFLNDDGPDGNGHKFCHKCGRQIALAKSGEP